MSLSVFLMLLCVSAGYGNQSEAIVPGIGASAIGEILKMADQARGNRDGITWKVSLLSSEDDGAAPMVLMSGHADSIRWQPRCRLQKTRGTKY